MCKNGLEWITISCRVILILISKGSHFFLIQQKYHFKLLKDVVFFNPEVLHNAVKGQGQPAGIRKKYI